MKKWLKWVLIIAAVLAVLYFLGVFDGMLAKMRTTTTATTEG